MNRKQRIVQRYQKQIQHFKTLAERKQLDEQARARRSEDAARKGPKGRRRGTDFRGEVEGDLEDGFEDDELFEKMRSHRGPLRSGSAGQGGGPSTGGVSAPVRGELEATVVGVHRGRVDLWLAGRRESVPVPGSMSEPGRFAVGDLVTLTRGAADALRLRTVEPRRTEIARPDPAHPKTKLVIAANVDLAVVVTSARAPAFKAGLVERFLIVLARGGVEPLVCLNKVDLFASTDERAQVRRRLAACQVPVLEVSTLAGEGVDELRAALAGRTVVFVGQSGVGKSSLVNALWSGLDVSTGAVRRGDGKGRHTTTRSTLLEPGDGTRVIDTPGIRSLGLWDVDRRDLAGQFPELADLAARCRFRDCLHAGEPDCAVRAAAQEGGDLDPERYAAYLRILDSLDG